MKDESLTENHTLSNFFPRRYGYKFQLELMVHLSFVVNCSHLGNIDRIYVTPIIFIKSAKPFLLQDQQFNAVCPPIVGSTASICGCAFEISIIDLSLKLQINMIGHRRIGHNYRWVLN
jgi:hypothetical protein